MADPGLRREARAGVLTLSIDRGSVRNALDRETLQALTGMLAEADADPDLRIVVLRGREPGPFSSGYDLGDLPEERDLDAAAVWALHEPVRQAAAAIAGCRHPVVAAVRSYAMGAALDLAAHADLRVAEAGARFALPAAGLGFTYPLEGVRRLCRTLGFAATEALLIEGRRYEAEALLARGFLHHVWASADFEASLGALVETLCQRAPLALRGIKRSLRLAGVGETDDAAEIEIYDHITRCMNSRDAREGRVAFRERRAPVFTGR